MATTKEFLDYNGLITYNTELLNSISNNYATQSWIESQGYLIEHQSLDNYPTRDEMNYALNDKQNNLVSTETVYINPDNTITVNFPTFPEIPDVSNFVTYDTMISNINDTISNTISNLSFIRSIDVRNNTGSDISFYKDINSENDCIITLELGYDRYIPSSSDISNWSNKQDYIEDLNTIRYQAEDAYNFIHTTGNFLQDFGINIFGNSYYVTAHSGTYILDITNDDVNAYLDRYVQKNLNLDSHYVTYTYLNESFALIASQLEETYYTKKEIDEMAESFLGGEIDLSGYATKTDLTNLKNSILGNATTAFDTLQEVEAWIKSHGTEASNMLSAISANELNISSLNSKLSTTETSIKSWANSTFKNKNEKVDRIEANDITYIYADNNNLIKLKADTFQYDNGNDISSLILTSEKTKITSPDGDSEISLYNDRIVLKSDILRLGKENWFNICNNADNSILLITPTETKLFVNSEAILQAIVENEGYDNELNLYLPNGNAIIESRIINGGLGGVTNFCNYHGDPIIHYDYDDIIEYYILDNKIFITDEIGFGTRLFNREANNDAIIFDKKGVTILNKPLYIDTYNDGGSSIKIIEENGTYDLLEKIEKNTQSLNGLSFWTGTQDEYDLIVTKDPSTLYIITD